jgi:hypothetical protein
LLVASTGHIVCRGSGQGAVQQPGDAASSESLQSQYGVVMGMLILKRFSELPGLFKRHLAAIPGCDCNAHPFGAADWAFGSGLSNFVVANFAGAEAIFVPQVTLLAVEASAESDCFLEQFRRRKHLWQV